MLRWLAAQLLEDSDIEEEGWEEEGGARACSLENSPAPVPVPAQLASTRQRRLEAELEQSVVDKQRLADLLWSGVPAGADRAEAWQLLLGYRPLSQQRRARTLSRKRLGYEELRREFYTSSPVVVRLRLANPSAPAETASTSSSSWSSSEEATLEQIRRDLPRTVVRGPHEQASCLQSLVGDSRVSSLMERVLFLWAVRQPAAGYVQGLNDVLLPLLLVFLAEAAGLEGLEGLGPKALDTLPSATLDEVEADSYWCLAKVLSEVVDHYTDGQPGLQRAAAMLRAILLESDSVLVQHLEDVGSEVGMDFLATVCMRWIACLVVRELPMHLCIRLWDTCIAESAEAGCAGFANFPTYFCAAFLLEHSAELRAGSFDEIMAFVQQPPTDMLTLAQLEATISAAYVLMASFQEHAALPSPKATRSPSWSSTATEDAKPEGDARNSHMTSSAEAQIAIDSPSERFVVPEPPFPQGQTQGPLNERMPAEEYIFSKLGDDASRLSVADRHFLSSDNGAEVLDAEDVCECCVQSKLLQSPAKHPKGYPLEISSLHIDTTEATTATLYSHLQGGVEQSITALPVYSSGTGQEAMTTPCASALVVSFTMLEAVEAPNCSA